MSKGKVLIIGSNATEIEVQGGKGKTGNYLNETVIPTMAVLEAGYEAVLVTPMGTKPHIDEASDSPSHFGNDQAAYQRAKDFWANNPAMNAPRTLRSVIDEGLQNYLGLFIPGGQAPMVDLMQDPDLGQILRHFHAEKKPTGMLCHGPISSVAAIPKAREFRAALMAGDPAKAAELAKGWQYAGYNMTIFSNSEEKWVEDDILHAKMIFHVVDALQTAGGNVTVGKDFAPYLIEDRELITGQNPRTDHEMGAALVKALNRASQTPERKAAVAG